MIIDTAIKILDNTGDTFPHYYPEEQKRVAARLGIAALKRIQKGRDTPFGTSLLPLPGETKE